MQINTVYKSPFCTEKENACLLFSSSTQKDTPNCIIKKKTLLWNLYTFIHKE